MKILSLLSFIIASLLIIACSSGSKISDPLINDIWALEFLKGVDYQPNESEEQRPMIEINTKEDKVTGNTGCNSMNGKVVIENNQIEFSNMAVTKMFCENSIEQDFLIALGMANNYKIEKLKLYLYQDDEQIMIFQKID